MKVLAIDPGYDRVGVAVVEKIGSQKEKLIFSDCILTKRTHSHYDRLLHIGKEIETLINEYDPEALAIEDLFFSTNQKTALKVSEARGVIMFVARALAVPIFEYKPNAVKIAITGYGAADKKHVAQMVTKLVQIKDSDKKLDDELDAIAIGITHLASVKMISKK